MNVMFGHSVRAVAFLLAYSLVHFSSEGAQSIGTAPLKVKLGDPMVDGSFLKTYKNAWKVVYAFPGKEPFLVGTWSDELSAVELNGRHLMKRTQIANYAKYDIITTNINVFDPRSMTPVYTEFSRNDPPEWVHRDFDGATVKYRRGKSADKSNAETGQIKMDVPVFDYHGGLYGLLLSAFPLKEGFTATIPTLSEDQDLFEWTTFTVRKPEPVEAGPGKQVMAWPVEIDEANKSHLVFWISKEAPYIIKLVNIIPSSRWVTVTMSII